MKALIVGLCALTATLAAAEQIDLHGYPVEKTETPDIFTYKDAKGAQWFVLDNPEAEMLSFAQVTKKAKSYFNVRIISQAYDKGYLYAKSGLSEKSLPKSQEEHIRAVCTNKIFTVTKSAIYKDYWAKGKKTVVPLKDKGKRGPFPIEEKTLLDIFYAENCK